VNKLRVSLVEKAGVIRGTIETDSDALFIMECLSMIVEQVSRRSGVAPLEVASDLHAYIARQQKEKNESSSV